MNKTLLLIAIIWLVVLNWNRVWPDTPKPVPNTVSLLLETQKYAGLYSLLSEDTKEPTPEPSSDCQCNKQTGKISYDGGTSLTDCPCSNGTQNCGCIHSNRGDLGTTIVEEQELVDPILADYYVVEWYGNPCVFCDAWNKTELPILEKAGVTVVKIKAFDNGITTEQGSKYSVTSVPRFFLCTKKDRKWHKNYNRIGYTKAQVIIEDIYRLHNNLNKKVVSKTTVKYRYMRPKRTGQTWNIVRGRNDKQGYIDHLRNEHGLSNWPLEQFDIQTLINIHSDAHNGTLGSYAVAQ